MKTSGREMRKMTAGEKGKGGKEESDAEKVLFTYSIPVYKKCACSDHRCFGLGPSLKGPFGLTYQHTSFFIRRRSPFCSLSA